MWQPLVEETWVVLHDAAEDCCSIEYSWIDRSSVPHGQLMHFTENIGQTSQENVTRIQWFPLKTYLLNLLFYWRLLCFWGSLALWRSLFGCKWYWYHEVGINFIPCKGPEMCSRLWRSSSMWRFGRKLEHWIRHRSSVLHQYSMGCWTRVCLSLNLTWDFCTVQR